MDLVVTRGEGVHNTKNFADVVHGRPPTFRVRPSLYGLDASPHLASLGK